MDSECGARTRAAEAFLGALTSDRHRRSPNGSGFSVLADLGEECGWHQGPFPRHSCQKSKAPGLPPGGLAGAPCPWSHGCHRSRVHLDRAPGGRPLAPVHLVMGGHFRSRSAVGVPRCPFTGPPSWVPPQALQPAPGRGQGPQHHTVCVGTLLWTCAVRGGPAAPLRPRTARARGRSRRGLGPRPGLPWHGSRLSLFSGEE